MHPLLKETRLFIKNHGLVTPGDRVVIGVSGGPDSLALLHVLAALAPELSFFVVAAYANHGLRPQEATDEQEAVSAAAARLNIPFVSKQINVQAYSKEHGLSIEHAARILRYSFFNDVLSEYAAHKIAVAHTADDQAEELLLRLIRGTGRKGLSGMDYLRDGLVIRPFLRITKDRLIAYLDEMDIGYSVDSSNFDRNYLRNRVRHELLPFLENEFNPGIRETLVRTAEILRSEEEFLDDLAIKAFNTVVTVNEESNQLPRAEIDGVGLSGLHPALQRRVLELLLWKMDNRPGSRQIKQILNLSKTPGFGEVHLAQGLRVQKNGDKIIFTYPHGRLAVRGSLRGEKQDYQVEINSAGIYAVSEIGIEITCELIDALPSEEEMAAAGIDYFDAGDISFPLQLRAVKSGDRFRPLGAPGTKKINDFFIDQKVPKQDRHLYPLLVAEDRIMGILGLRASHAFRVNTKTQKVLRVSRICTEVK
ncbi:MAG: tRNA lysidine(34) synthetase TilS [Proteobacteria bacterium]|nr:tRNA lysidine(34) synthetase TilS [Pseudomonadota bacterium]MBU1710011.1 tRNA lysidine(34) synthetase TilS [Pseudomonadota bacterium]